MYLSKALYQRLVGTMYMLQSVYALFFVFVGADKLMQITDVSWLSYVSAFIVQTAPVTGTVLLTIIAVVQLCVAALLMIPGLQRLGAYIALCMLLFGAIDLLLINIGELVAQSALYAVAAAGVFGLLQLQYIYRGLHS